MLNGQDRRLIDAVERDPGITAAGLADAFAVSERTIRTYIRHANSALEGAAVIELRRGAGYSLKVVDQDRVESLRDQAQQGPMPSSRDERVAYLVGDLLSRTDWITLDDLAQMMFVSRNVISSDLKRATVMLERFGLSLDRRPHYGVRVSGSEMSRRLCLANLTLDGVVDRGGGPPNSLIRWHSA